MKRVPPSAVQRMYPLPQLCCEIILGYDTRCFMENKVNQFLIDRHLKGWLPDYEWNDRVNMIIFVMEEIFNHRDTLEHLTQIELEEKFRKCFTVTTPIGNIHYSVHGLREFVSEMMDYF
ncbi:MAG: hypothetical protein Solumvirus2_54 [Solumvirus sp.]|uniref:Uncharacterized protein n=1 Tax=Solumvirus sp. TaxID=2487773 RepID=A0A3G5AGD7_9VIRU|nr:MAG: hypothetical protein Solumvirus2_54 [Solumvirus sp.]